MSFDPSLYLSQAEAYTQGPIQFHIVGLTDVSHSKLSQLDRWKEYEDPNKVSVDRVNNRGTRNQIIREVNMDGDNENQPPAFTGQARFKLTLRDQQNNYCFAYEYNDKLSFLRQGTTTTPLPIPLGSRILVNKGTLILNGVLMLNRAQCSYLGVLEEDNQLSAQLNNGIVKKYITYLTEDLKNSK
ncbi:hypothetical protein CAAN1_01S13498 [[Candida] anglica]|uniref:RecQ mediated genome instability protein 1 OB-fold domain-containing protein n=1 Tax=[Candida] anglica TaxID=148631 RepID=A0ABP0EL04_9ASCO